MSTNPNIKLRRLRRAERNVTAIEAIDIGNTTEETVNVNQTNPMPVEETEHVENTEKISEFNGISGDFYYHLS